MIALLSLGWRHRALAGAAAGALAAALAGGWLAHRLDASARARVEARAAAAEAQARALAAQVRLDTVAANAVEAARTAQTRAEHRTGAAADEIARLPHAQDPLDGDVLDRWGDAVDGMRRDAAAARSGAAPARGGEPARAVSAP